MTRWLTFASICRQLGNSSLYVRLNPVGGLSTVNLADFTRGAEIELITTEYLRHPNVDDIIDNCAFTIGVSYLVLLLLYQTDLLVQESKVSPKRPLPVFKPLYHTGFEVDPFLCSDDEAKQLYRDLLPREPLIGYRSFVGNGAFTLEFEGLRPVRWRSFLNADLLGPVRAEATVDLSRCTTVRTPSGAGVLVILLDPTLGDVCCDLFFLVEPSHLRPVLHVIKLSRTDDWVNLHSEPLPHCAGQQVVQIEVTLLDDQITVSTNSVASAWTLCTPTSGGPKRLRAFGLCGIGPKKITWTSFGLSVVDPQPGDDPLPTPPIPTPPSPVIPPPIDVLTTTASLKTLITSHKATVVFFTAPTGACEVYESTFGKLARDNNIRSGAKFVKVDASAVGGREIARACNIRVTPTFLFFLDGVKVNFLFQNRSNLDVYSLRAHVPSSCRN